MHMCYDHDFFNEVPCKCDGPLCPNPPLITADSRLSKLQKGMDCTERDYAVQKIVKCSHAVTKQIPALGRGDELCQMCMVLRGFVCHRKVQARLLGTVCATAGVRLKPVNEWQKGLFVMEIKGVC